MSSPVLPQKQPPISMDRDQEKVHSPLTSEYSELKTTKIKNIKKHSDIPSVAITHRSHRAVVEPTFSLMAKNDIDQLPLYRLYEYHKSGKTAPLCKPKINDCSHTLVNFSLKHFSLENLTNNDKDALQHIRCELENWLDFLNGNWLLHVNKYTLLVFIKNCIRGIDASLSSDTKKTNLSKNKHLFVLTFDDQNNEFNLNRVTAALSYCEASNKLQRELQDIYVLESFVNPKYQAKNNKIVIRGSGRALRQGIINFVENSDCFDSVSSVPANSVSAYLNFTMGFKPREKTEAKPCAQFGKREHLRLKTDVKAGVKQ